MTRKSIAAAAIIAAACISTSASAGPYTDDMSKCLVKNASSDDQISLMQWMFAMLSLNPSVKPMLNLTDAQRDGYNKKAADLFQRLLFTDCHTETLTALKYEGPTAMSASFQVLGQVAARGLMGDPNVTTGMQGLMTHMDQSKWQQLLNDAGISTAQPSGGAATGAAATP